MTKISYETIDDNIILDNIRDNEFFVYQQLLCIKLHKYYDSEIIKCLCLEDKRTFDLKLSAIVYIPTNVDIKVTY